MPKSDHNVVFIKSICDTLTTSEKRMAGKYLLFFEGQDLDTDNSSDRRKHKKGSLGYQYFQLIVTYKGGAVEDLNLIIAKKFSPNQRRNLGNRVLRKLHDFLILEINIEKNKIEPRLKIQQFLYRNISILQVLLSKRLFQNFSYFSKKLLTIANNYELYYEVCAILRLELSLMVHRTSPQEFQKHIAEYDKKMFLADRINKIVLNVASIQVLFNKKISNDKILDYLTDLISELEVERKHITSDSWYISYYRIILEYNQQIRNYSEGNRICKKLIEVYHSNKYIATNNKIGLSYSQLANNQLFAKEFKDAIRSSMNALQYLKPGFLNSVVTSEILFLAQYHSGEVFDANKLVESIIKYDSVKKNKLYLARWEYYRTVLLFKEKKFKEAGLNLHNCTILNEDKEGWGIGLRILNLMLLVERENVEGIEFELENFRKQLNKLKKEGIVSKRYLAIYRIFVKLNANGFNYPLFNAKKNKDYINLISEAEGFYWEVRSPELIRFDVWLMEKMQPA